jgi:Domain of unknown function (DUF4350)
VKGRLITLAYALGAFALFFAMFVQREGGGRRSDIPRPTTAERRGNGYNAAQSWLEAEGIRNISLRDRFDSLAKRRDLPPSGNLLIVTLPAASGFNTWEFIPLDHWVRAGNTLLVLAALSDTPDWTFAIGGIASGDVNLLTGIEFETARKRAARLRKSERSDSPGEPSDAPEGRRPALSISPLLQPRREELVPNRAHPYFTDVRRVASLSDYAPQRWVAKVPYEGFLLELAHESRSGEGALWTRPLGRGRIIVSAFGSLFTNRAIGMQDNARLFANIVGANVSERGAVLFDDLHQGLGATYDPDKFYKDRRLHITLGVLVALWLIWVLGSARLHVAVSKVSAPREAELIRAAGGFLWRALPSHAGARRLIENFFRRVSGRADGRRDSDAPWDLLERHTRVNAADLGQLKSWYADAHASRRVPLDQLQNLIVRIDRQMAT